MSLKILLYPFVAIFYIMSGMFYFWRAHQRKRRSIHDLRKLDEHLLRDVGFYRRKDGRILSVKTGLFVDEPSDAWVACQRLRFSRYVRRGLRRWQRSVWSLGQ